MNNNEEYEDLTDIYKEKRGKFKNITSPIEPKIRQLPLKDISWEDFEYLCFLLSTTNENLSDQTPYGKKGQSQKGIDIIANIKNKSKKWVCQCKRYKSMTSKQLCNFVSEFLNKELADNTSIYVFATTVDLSDIKFIKTIDSIRKELSRKNIEFRPWGSLKINQILKKKYPIVNDCFGDVWANAFCLKNNELKYEKIKEKALKIGIFSYHATPKGEEFQFDLDLSALFKLNELETEWQTIFNNIVKFKTHIQDSSPVKILIINPKVHLSIGFLFGYIFRETTGYKLLINQYNEIWSLNEKLSNKQWNIKELTGNNPNSNNLIVIIRIGTNDVYTPTQSYLNKKNTKYYQMLIFTIDEYIKSDDIYILVQTIIEVLKKKVKQEIKFHIFASIPVGFSILLGSKLNVLIPVQIYEYVKLKKKYEASFLIDR